MAGVTVVDLANVIAGPAAGRTLAELGAEVIHVSPVAPAMGPRMTLLLGLEVNQGKRSIALDLRTSGGADVLARLVGDGDVVLYNKLPDQAARLGLAPAQIHAVNPRAVVTAITAYSGPQPGGWEGRPAYDPVVQAATGIMRRFGGDEAPAVHGIASCIDYFTGFSAAFAAIVGLVARGQGTTHLVARTSLVRTAGWVQLPQLNERTPGPSGLDARGPGPLDRLYRAKDGWLLVQAPNLGLATGLTASLAVALRELDVPDAMAAAKALGVEAHEVRDVRRLRRDASASGRVLVDVHPSGERLWLTSPRWIRSGSRPVPGLAPAPSPGEHSRQLLAELGYGSGEVDELLGSEAVVTSWATGNRYMPA